MKPMKKKKFDKEEYFKKVDEKKSRESGEKAGGIIAVVIIFIVLSVVMGFIMDGCSMVVKKVTNSDAKDYCSTTYKVKSAKTEYAAKLAYKECMRNY